MTNKIKVTGTINSWGHNSIDSAEVFFNKHIEDCSCGGSYSFSAMLQMEQIKEGDLVDDCATIEWEEEWLDYLKKYREKLDNSILKN